MAGDRKIIIFSHENDIDGMGSIILGKKAFSDIDYVLASNVNVLEEKFRNMLENGQLDGYDNIYITDLSLYRPAIDLVNDNKNLSNKVLVFDHHRSAINDGYDKYSFVTLKESDETGKKRCGTDLFYEYLIDNNYIKRTQSLDDFVELTRLEDTWEWKYSGSKGVKAHDLAILFNVIGIDNYISLMTNELSKDSEIFELSKAEQAIVENRKREYLALLNNIWNDSECFVDISNNKFSAVYAEYEYRNELAEYVKTLNIEDLKYLVIIALEKGQFGQKSYRSIDESFDVGKIADEHGGSGHPGAASVNITEEQRKHALVLKSKNKRESLEYLVNCSFID